MTLRGASRGLRPARSRSAQGACGPPRASLRFAGSRAPPGGMRPGSRGHQGPTRVARLGALRCPRHKRCARLFGQARSPVAPGPLPLRGSRSGLRARARFAGRVRRLAPSLRSPSPGPGRSPRLSRSGVVRACALRPRSLAPSGLAVPSAPVRASCRSPFLCSGSAVASAWPRRVPPWPSLRASGPGASSPGAVPGFARLSSPAPGLFLRGPACGPLLRFSGAFVVVRGSPLRPPAPPSPLGPPGSASLFQVAFGPPLGPAFRRPASGPPSGPGARRARPRRG